LLIVRYRGIDDVAVVFGRIVVFSVDGDDTDL
jgi:hypothetical protein